MIDEYLDSEWLEGYDTFTLCKVQSPSNTWQYSNNSALTSFFL